MIIITHSENYSVDDDGNIGRQDMTPSGQWKFRGIARVCNFGTIEVVAFKDLPSRIEAGTIDWSFKNGKPKWCVLDNDHGTNRMWTRRLTKVVL